MWVKHNRRDILSWVNPLQMPDGTVDYDIWIHPVKFNWVQRCPWLRKVPGQDRYRCRIHDVKPELCKKYPKTKKHAQKSGCRGFDP